MKIMEALRQGGKGAVLADETNGVVRLWTLARPFRDGRALRALRRFFPTAEIRGDDLIRLGGFSSLADAHRFLAEAKTTSSSSAIRGLFRYDVPESLATLKQIS
jgi:hypothetical protein